MNPRDTILAAIGGAAQALSDSAVSWITGR